MTPTATARARWLALPVLLFAILQREAHVVPWSVFLPVIAGAAGVTTWRTRAAWRSDRSIAWAAGLFGVFLLAAAMPALLGEWTVDRSLMVAAIVVAGWTACLLVLVAHPPRQHGHRPGTDAQTDRGSWAVPLLIAAAFLVLTGAHWAMQADHVAFFDEPLYVLQSRLMREPGFARPIDETLRPFFAIRQTIFSDGRFYTQYPPGHPAILAVFELVGLRWWSGVLLSTAGVLFTYLLGRDLHSGFAGRAAAAMLGANQLFVTYGASYMAHSSTIALATAAAWLLIRSERLHGWKVWCSWSLAGLLLGGTIAIRPLTGAALMASITLWQFVRRRHSPNTLVGLAGLMVVGTAVPVLGVLYYNAATNGSPFVFGYAAAHGALHDLGFGQRGFVAPDLLGQPAYELVDFTFGQAVANFFVVMSQLAPVVLPAFVFVPIAVIARRHGFRVAGATIAAFLVLPAVQFFYFYWHTRFYLELLPFVFVVVAAALAHVRRQDPALVRALLMVVLATELLATGLEVGRRMKEGERSAWHAVRTAVRDAHQPGQKLLVFIAGEYETLNWASWFNIDDFPGDVIVARDLGDENRRLQRVFPDHSPVQLTLSGARARLRRLDE